MEGGYNIQIPVRYNNLCRMFWNLEFWKALDKEIGFDKMYFPYCNNRFANKDCPEMKSCSNCGKGYTRKAIKGNWLEVWHFFIDHLAEGKTIESFFEQF